MMFNILHAAYIQRKASSLDSVNESLCVYIEPGRQLPFLLLNFFQRVQVGFWWLINREC